MMTNMIAIKGANIGTMSSKEIADLTEKRHDGVKRTIDTLAEKEAIQLPQIVEVTNHLGQTVTEYRIGKRDSYIVVAQLSPKFTARLVDRWQALEEVVARPDPMAILSGPASLRLVLLGYTETVIALEGKVAEQHAVLALQAPKVEALDMLATRTDGSVCVTNAAKDLQVPPRRLYLWLQVHGWIYRRAGDSGYVAYQQRIKTGYLEHKVVTVERTDGSVRMVEQVLVTAKGLAKLAVELRDSFKLQVGT